MMEAVNHFRDETTPEDLGFGAIRDAFSCTLFPQVSSIQTRLRYVLFLPWLRQEVSHRDTVGRMQTQFREHEFQLIEALKRGGEALGVIGRDAGRTLQRLPSEIYWGALVALKAKALDCLDQFPISDVHRESVTADC